MESKDFTEGMRVRIDGYGEPGYVTAEDKTLNGQTATVEGLASAGYYVIVRLDVPSAEHHGLETVFCTPQELTVIDTPTEEG